MLPIVNISPLFSESSDPRALLSVQQELVQACHSYGFFYISGHGVSETLIEEMKAISYEFFSLSQSVKDSFSMNRGGKAWRGYFRLGDELTSGIPDQKEGYYFGEEIESNDTRSTLPLHGPNFWPDGEIGRRMRGTVLEYMREMKRIAQTLIRAIFLGIGIEYESVYLDQFTCPTELFRIFRYPPHNNDSFPSTSMGVGEHTDYGYLTILWQECVDVNGLQARSIRGDEWIDVPAIPGTFVVNLGDALEHHTEGLLRATPHRVLQRLNAASDRLSFPYFFDPSFSAEMLSLISCIDQGKHPQTFERLQDIKRKRMNGDIVSSRWDQSDPTLFKGTYGKYLLGKVSKAFPELANDYKILD